MYNKAVKQSTIIGSKAESYLATVDEAKGLFEALDYPPSRIRAILVRTFKDYFKGKIEEGVLLEVGSILHMLQLGTWDRDPDILSISCSLDDFHLKRNLTPRGKKVREKLYKDLYKSLSSNQTIPISLPISFIKKLEEDDKVVQEVLKETFWKLFRK